MKKLLARTTTMTTTTTTTKTTDHCSPSDYFVRHWPVCQDVGSTAFIIGLGLSLSKGTEVNVGGWPAGCARLDQAHCGSGVDLIIALMMIPRHSSLVNPLKGCMVMTTVSCPKVIRHYLGRLGIPRVCCDVLCDGGRLAT